jgi:capsular polysaccharide biosynthesis protein
VTALDLVRIMRANLKLLAIAALIGTLLAAGYTLTRPTLYTASSTAQVIAGNSVDANAAVLSQQLSSGRAGYYAQLASSSGVANRIVEQSKGSLKPGDFAVAGSSSEGSATLTLLATASSPAKAQRAADLARTALADEAKYMETVGTDAKTSVYRVFPLTAAARPSAPSSPNWQRNLVAGAAVGLLAGIVLVVLRKQLDSRIRHTSEVEKLTGSGVPGVIPKAPTLQSKRHGGLGELGTTAEAFRMLHRLAGTGLSGEMHDRLGAIEPAPGIRVTHVSADHFAGKARRGRVRVRMNLCTEQIERNHVVLRRERPSEVLPDETGASGDEDRHGAFRSDVRESPV